MSALSEEQPKSGLIVSCVLHAGLLALIIVGFASAPKFQDASEATAVDTVTDAQFQQMMGERTAELPPAAQPTKPAPVAPPQPPQPPPELRQAEEAPPPPPTPSEPPKPEPPKPEPPKPEPPKPEPPPPPVKPAPPKPAPVPPPRPEPPPKPDALEKPLPPVRPKTVDAQPPERPREPPPPVPRPPDKPKPDALARLLADASPKEPARSQAKPADSKPFDPRAIARLIGDNKPSTSQANPGAPTARAQRMTGSQERQLDDWFKEAYMACWSPPPTTPEGDVYIPQVEVTFNADGTLSGQPELVNPPPDPAWRAVAESAKRAALRCNPMKIPSQYSPFFEQWRTKTIHFDPREAQG